MGAGFLILLVFGGSGIGTLPPERHTMDDYIWIDGYVKDQFGTPVSAALVEYYNKTTMVLQETDQTNANGYYQTAFIFTGQKEHRNLEDVLLFPNPSTDHINLVFDSPGEETYRLLITNLEGKMLYSADVKTEKGPNRINITGGQKGTHIITLAGKEGAYVSKAILLSDTDAGFQHRISREDNSLLKSTADDPEVLDSLLIVYSKAGYVTADTTVAPETQTINITLEKLPMVRDIKIKPYTINGDEITSLTLDFKWANNEVTQHSVASDGFIYVRREELTNVTATALVTHNSDTATYALWQFFRLSEGHQLKDTNYAQSPKVVSPNGSSNYTPPTATPLNLPEGEDTLKLDLYLPHTQVPHPMQPGQNIRLDNYEVRFIMGSRASGMSTKYIDVPAVPRKLVHYQFTFDQANPGVQMPPADLQLAVEERAKILEKFTLNNGKRVFPEDTTATFTSTNDPFYLLIQSQGFAQTARTAYRTGMNPGNGCALTTNNSSNGKSIIDFSYSAYPSPVLNTIFAEMFQQYTYVNDPLSGGIGGWVRSSTGEMTPFGEEILHLLCIMNQGTYVH
jgi:hypothetical protein